MTERRILITGANGFVGGYMIQELLAAGYQPSELHTVTVSGGMQKSGAGPAHVCDLKDGTAIDRLLAEVRPTGIVHLAAIALPSQAKEDPSSAWAVNFESVRKLGHAVLVHAPQAVLVFAGSSESYGASFNVAEGPVEEATALRPMTPYASTKAAADVALGQMRYDGLNAIRFRAFNHTGPGQSPDYVVASFANQIARIASGDQPPVIRVGNLDAERDFLDVRDVVCAYRLALETPIVADSEAVFNLASGVPRSIRSILDKLIEVGGVHVTVETDMAKMRKNDVPRTWGDNTRARRELGWSPQLAFDQTLADTLSATRLKPN